LIATFNKLNSRRQGAVILWSANLKKLRNLEVYSGLGTVSSQVVGLLFAGESEQYVTACYSSGFVVVSTVLPVHSITCYLESYLIFRASINSACFMSYLMSTK